MIRLIISFKKDLSTVEVFFHTEKDFFHTEKDFFHTEKDFFHTEKDFFHTEKDLIDFFNPLWAWLTRPS
jgi:hypothetical protein